MNQTASAEMQQVAALLSKNKAASTAKVTVEEMRTSMEQMQSALAPLQGATITTLDIAADQRMLSARWHTMPNSSTAKTVLYLHGGGYALGSLDTHKELMVRLAQATSARVLGIDYRLAPEHPFPAGLEDAMAAYRWLIKQQQVAANNIAIVGDSAGGGLSLALLMTLRDQLGQADALPMPSCAVLFSPWTDLAATGKSITAQADLDPMITIAGLRQLADYYRGDEAANHPLVSPLYGDFSGLPPLLVQVGEHEVLLDDSLRLQDVVDKSGAHLDLEVFAQAFHVFQAFPGIPEATVALERVGEFLDKKLSEAS